MFSSPISRRLATALLEIADAMLRPDAAPPVPPEPRLAIAARSDVGARSIQRPAASGSAPVPRRTAMLAAHRRAGAVPSPPHRCTTPIAHPATATATAHDRRPR